MPDLPSDDEELTLAQLHERLMGVWAEFDDSAVKITADGIELTGIGKVPLHAYGSHTTDAVLAGAVTRAVRRLGWAFTVSAFPSGNCMASVTIMDGDTADRSLISNAPSPGSALAFAFLAACGQREFDLGNRPAEA